MLKQRPAGDKSWPIACSQTTLGTADKKLDLSGAHLSYGDFEEAKFQAEGAIRLNGTGLAHAVLSGSKLTADGGFGNALIDLSDADLAYADLRGSELTATTTGNYGATWLPALPTNLAIIDFTAANLANARMSGSWFDAEGDESIIDFTEANLANADLSESKFEVGERRGWGDDIAAIIDFTGANLTNASLSGSKLEASNNAAIIDFTEATLANARLSDLELTAEGEDGATIDFTEANLANGDLSGLLLHASALWDYATIDFTEANLAYADLSGSKLFGDSGETGLIDFTEANLANANLSGSVLATSNYEKSTIAFTQADLTNADLSGSELNADTDGASLIDFTQADLAHADLSGSDLTATSSYGSSTIDFTQADLTHADLSGSELTADTDGASLIDFTQADLAHADLSGADYVDFIFTFDDENTWCSGYRQSGPSYGGFESTQDIEIYTGDANFGPWTKVATDSHSTWHNGGTNTFPDDGTTTEWTPTAPSKYLKVRTLTNHGATYQGGVLTVRFLQLKFGVVPPPPMDWKWPAEHGVDYKDYHPRIGGGQEEVGGWDRGTYKLANVCDSSSAAGRGYPFHTYSAYGVNGADYVDFIFTFDDDNTWCSGYRQTGYSGWGYGTPTFTQNVEIYTGDANFGPWTKVAKDSHSDWHSGATPTFPDDGTTTEWTPTAPSKYLLVHTLTNHGDTAGRLAVQFLQLKFWAPSN